MTDTQWPRYEVFVQEAEGKPHQHAGSVHAPDPEMAVLNARDVFVRRPECVSLWVAEARAIHARPAEGLKESSDEESLTGGEGPGEPEAAYAVFGKLDHKGTLVHLGGVRGRGSSAAMTTAMERFSHRRPLVLWVIEDARITRSQDEEAEAFFEPARHKPFRDQAFYHIQTALRRLKLGKGP